jgi:hypothetical protein
MDRCNLLDRSVKFNQKTPTEFDRVRSRIRATGIGIALTAGLMPHLPLLKVLSDAEDEQLNLSLSSMRDRSREITFPARFVPGRGFLEGPMNDPSSNRQPSRSRSIWERILCVPRLCTRFTITNRADPIATFESVRTSVKKSKESCYNMESSTHSIEVNAPLNAVFDQWTQFEEFPHFMEGIEEVRQEAEKFDIL